ncbi:hypothetical protein Patl1_00147 [Pistacia atlantica]|uniref:Uncharacterized protein n=1 Tax=Pistacia atlantica TaxID=434234 RepID=A0ACC1C5I8_9ROSI|nr:hypothetical protein Patl1_00147 [Pistacia atlantica]
MDAPSRAILPQPSGEGTSQRAEPSSASVPRLNPFAKEWNPVTDRAPEEDRCLFLTFSNGYPLTENQITRFFNDKYGPCVERVYVHSPVPRNMNAPPLFGKVVFKVSYIPAAILSGHKQTKFTVDGKPLWCKKFEAKKKEDHHHGSDN